MRAQHSNPRAMAKALRSAAETARWRPRCGLLGSVVQPRCGWAPTSRIHARLTRVPWGAHARMSRNGCATQPGNPMKKIALLLLSLSIAACATDDESYGGSHGGPKFGKPLPPSDSLTVEIDPTINPGTGAGAPQKDYDGRLEWAEEINGMTVVHSFDPLLGIDNVEVLDQNGDAVPTVHDVPPVLDVDGRR